MSTSTTTADGGPTPTMIQPGERAVLLSFHEFQLARSRGQGLDDYDILMRQPEELESEGGAPAGPPVWLPVPAAKYLKHRATGWVEAATLEDLPESRREEARKRGAFPNPAKSKTRATASKKGS